MTEVQARMNLLVIHVHRLKGSGLLPGVDYPLSIVTLYQLARPWYPGW
jgi:hypothetical protein